MKENFVGTCRHGAAHCYSAQNEIVNQQLIPRAPRSNVRGELVRGELIRELTGNER